LGKVCLISIVNHWYSFSLTYYSLFRIFNSSQSKFLLFKGAKNWKKIYSAGHSVSANEVNYNPADVDLKGWKFYGYKEKVKIFMPRYVSELRDNHLCKNDFILKWKKKVKNLIKM